MSTLTKEQLLKYASAWQAFILILPWYLNEFGIDTLNRLLGFVGLLIVFVILFLNRGETEKVAVAVGTVDRFLKSQVETEKAKEASEKDIVEQVVTYVLKSFTDSLTVPEVPKSEVANPEVTSASAPKPFDIEVP